MKFILLMTWGLLLFGHPTPQLAATPAASSGPEIITAEPLETPAEEIILREMTRAQKEGRQLLVYVGATWCEPCQRFKNALKKGELDTVFPTLRLLEFDRTQDESRLEDAGYISRLIPLFAIPGPNGHASGKQIEGSIKGEGAVGNIIPRLRRLLGE